MAAVFYGVNNPLQAAHSIKHARANASEQTEIWYVDNGSNEEYWPAEAIDIADRVILYPENIGGNAVFHRWIKDNWFHPNVPEFIGFFHVDMYIRENNWDLKVIDLFDQHQDLMLQGFVGSGEIDERGGRGGDTKLNYLGDTYEGIGQASPAERHGRRLRGAEWAAVLDHCSMIFRSDWLRSLKSQEEYYAPEHFYDRILCCETLSRGGKIAVNGISCDHFGGGVGGGIPGAAKLCREWLDARGIAYGKDQERTVTYVESEKLFHQEYLETGFIPLKVKPDGTVYHQHVKRGGFWRPR